MMAEYLPGGSVNTLTIDDYSDPAPPIDPPEDPPEDNEDGEGEGPRPHRIDVAINSAEWSALRNVMEQAGVDVEAALAAELGRPENADPETACAWQLDAAFNKLSVAGAILYRAAKVDGHEVRLRSPDKPDQIFKLK